MHVYLGVEMEAIDASPVIQIIGSVVFAASGDLQLVSLWLLEAPNVADCVLPSQNWILTRSLLPTAPPWVPKYVHVWAPVGQPCEPPIVHGSSLVGHHLRAS